MIGKFVAVVVVTVFVSTFTASRDVQQSDGPVQPDVPPQPESKASNSDQLQYVPPPFDPSIFVDVDPGLQLDANTTALYQKMASTLNGSPFVPQSRLDYFSFYANSNIYTIGGWGAFVENVQATGDGYLVTIRVQPGVSSKNKGASIILGGPNYYEQYQVGNGQFTYQGFLDPDGTAGQQFGEIGL